MGKNKLYSVTMAEFKLQMPPLHKKAVAVKNMRRHQHDGGRAWIKDGQLHDAIKGVNPEIRHIKG
jgi:hypothetical protein